MTVKSGLQKICLKFLHAEAIFFYAILLHRNCKITNSVTKITIFPHGGKSEFFLPYELDLIDLQENFFY